MTYPHHVKHIYHIKHIYHLLFFHANIYVCYMSIILYIIHTMIQHIYRLDFLCVSRILWAVFHIRNLIKSLECILFLTCLSYCFHTHCNEQLCAGSAIITS